MCHLISRRVLGNHSKAGYQRSSRWPQLIDLLRQHTSDEMCQMRFLLICYSCGAVINNGGVFLISCKKKNNHLI